MVDTLNLELIEIRKCNFCQLNLLISDSELSCGLCFHCIFGDLLNNCLACNTAISTERIYCSFCNDLIFETEEILRLFRSVSIKKVDLTVINFNKSEVDRGIGKVRASIKSVSLAKAFFQLRDEFLFSNKGKDVHIFVRPICSESDKENLRLIQLDDISINSLEDPILADNSLFILQTSEGNYQATIAIKSSRLDYERTRKFLITHFQADSGCGATSYRVGFNLKPKYWPNNPVVRVVNKNSGRIISVQDLEDFGLDEFTETVISNSGSQNQHEQKFLAEVTTSARSFCGDSSLFYELYKDVLQKTSLKVDGITKDFSKADYATAKELLLVGGLSTSDVEQIVADCRLKHVDDKGVKNRSYINRTVKNACRALGVT